MYCDTLLDMRIYKQSGAIPYFIENEIIKYVLITSNSGNWIFPKGLIEFGMKPWQSALKEAEEEAGISGEVFMDVVATYEYKKWGGLCQVDMYLLKITEIYDTWDEKMFRKRKICTFKHASQIIHGKVKDVLIKAANVIMSKL